MAQKCPVCNTELIDKGSYSSELGIEEYHLECPNKCFSEHFAYGNTEFHMGNAMLGYGYADSEEVKFLVHESIKALAILQRTYDKLKGSKK